MGRCPTQAESEGRKCRRPSLAPVDLPGVTKDVADLTGLLQAWGRGDAEALEQLAPLVHLELRGVARRLLADECRGRWRGSRPSWSRSRTCACSIGGVQWQNRAHFFATAARMMRRVLVDAARARARSSAARGTDAARRGIDVAAAPVALLT